MPQITDRSAIRAFLKSDRNWAVYALGDLAPYQFERSVWISNAAATALVLLYRGFETPVLFALGKPLDVEPLLKELGSLSKMYLHVRPEILPIFRVGYEIHQEKTMLRMVLDPHHFEPASSEDVVRLTITDRQALERLYADGQPSGEAPEFFVASMLNDGVYCGIKQGSDLLAAAGTHLVVRPESVAAIGNVYTRRDRRGRGLAARVTSAVTNELLTMNLRTIALNVNENNETATRVYEKLGFATYCDFKEGLATRMRF
jgi:ribosomal protein S18 acetylase RimI-like enzyme